MTFDYLKGIVYNIIEFFVIHRKRHSDNKKKILVIKVDEIGDYILFRKFLAPIIQSEICEGAIVHFCGNIAWKTLFDIEYPSVFAKHYWLNKKLFKSNILYRFSFLKRIYNEQYTVIINPTFSRAKRVDDAIVKAARAANNIGMVRNNENYKPFEMYYDRKLYTTLFKAGEKLLFELERNRQFASFLCKKELPLQMKFDLSKINHYAVEGLPEKFIVVFPGSRSEHRIWPAKYFAAVSSFFQENYHTTVVVCGAEADAKYATDFINIYAGDCINLIGKTSLLQLLYILSKAYCLISVDTGSIHLAASVGCTTFGIFNGSQYGRFSPYPKNIEQNVYAVYPDEVDEAILKGDLGIYEYVVPIPYDSVPPKKVIDIIQQHFKFRHEI